MVLSSDSLILESQVLLGYRKIIPKEGTSAALNSCLLDVYFVYLTIKIFFHKKVGLFLSPSFKKKQEFWVKLPACYSH